ncbi:MAG: hypothetical protein NT031_19820 [Planctomycetota bacterium]|nr:hypothetical protein [Planctomycetota bacterium]
MLDLVSPHVVGQSPTSLAAFHRYRHESGLGKVFLYGRKMRWQVLRPLAVVFWTPEDKDIVIHDLVQCHTYQLDSPGTSG